MGLCLCRHNPIYLVFIFFLPNKLPQYQYRPHQSNYSKLFAKQKSRTYQSEERIQINIVGSSYRSQLF